MIKRREFLLAMAALASGCTRVHRAIVVGTKNFTEQLVLGELVSQHLQASSLPVELRPYLAGTYICHQAILAGRIDVYVEYTGTALEAILKQPPMQDHGRVLELVRDRYRRKFDLEVLAPLGFDNSFAMVIRGDDARRLHLNTLSDAAPSAPQWRIGVGYEFLERQDGYPGLARAYGFHFAEPPRVMDLGLLYRALQAKHIDMIAASNTDGLIAALDLVVLRDDRHYFPPYDAVPIVRRPTLARFPALDPSLSQLAGRITADDMRRLNYAIDGERSDVRAVVRSFLAAHGLNGSLNQSGVALPSRV